MNRQEFLEKLRHALANDLPAASVQEHVTYYQQYIMEEMARGRSESEIIGELGDPWALAQTVIRQESGENFPEGGQTYSYSTVRDETYEESGRQAGDGQSDRVLSRILTIIMVVLLILFVVAVALGLLKVLLPVIVVYGVYRFIRMMLRK